MHNDRPKSKDDSVIKTVRSVRSLSLMTAIALLAGVLVATTSAQRASAADPSQFDPGLIVSDAVFFDGGAMTAGEVQNFLQSQVPRCFSTYACLTTYRQNTPTVAGEANRCATYDGRANESAADIIARVGVACGVSQKALIVLLQKEQGLVTATTPSQSKFDKATGMACPDTAPCDPAFSGFFYQVYYAAKQFKNYAANPARWNHVAGRVSNVRFHPNVACGSKSVYIVNQATAGLYNYTPYTPNAAALGNLYGTGDGCSSYGNRNFWRLFSDWFGSPTVGSSLIKTASSPNIFLLSGDAKHLITNSAMLASFSHLGGVATVSQSVADAYVTGANASRVIRAPGGAIYFHDARIKLGIPTCELVADYGGSCDPSGYTQLTDYQVNSFLSGPTLGSLFGTVEGGRYMVTLGTRKEILDAATKAENGLTGSYPILTESALELLPFAAPLARDSVVIRDSNTGALMLFAGGVKYALSTKLAAQTGLSTRVAGQLRTVSLAFLEASTVPFVGLVSANGVSSVLTSAGRVSWSAGAGGLTSVPVPIAPEVVSSFPESASVGLGSVVKAAGSSTIYLVGASSIRPFSSWSALVAVAGTPSVTVVPDELVLQLPKGQPILPPGSLVKSSDNPRVYLVDGLDKRLPLQSFDQATAAGISGYQTVAPEVLALGYPTVGVPVGYGLACGATNYVAAGGALHLVRPELLNSYPIAFTPYAASTCAALRVGAPADRFIRVPTGAIYMLDAGTKRPISSMTRFAELGGTSLNYLNVDVRFAALLPVGPAA
jgi:hypothetical protein